MKELIDLFITFARIGAFTFGGGYAMLPILQREVVEKKKWCTDEELTDYYAIGQCTPGIIAVNTATFIGYKTKGVLGGIIATLGLICPSVIIITIISAFIKDFANLPIVQNAFSGIRVAVSILIINTVIKLIKKSVIDKYTLIIFILVLSCGILFKVSPIIFILVSGILGVVFKNIDNNTRKNTKE